MLDQYAPHPAEGWPQWPISEADAIRVLLRPIPPEARLQAQERITDGGARARRERPPALDPTLAQVAIDYSFTVELCTPRSPEQKGAVENLVGWVKKSFFRARHTNAGSLTFVLQAGG
jgi:hypothetical protein